MPRISKPKFELGEKTKQLIEKVEAALLERGAKPTGGGELIEALVMSINQNVIDHYVIEKTPMEYKVKRLLEDEMATKELNKLAKRHDFGLTTTP